MTTGPKARFLDAIKNRIGLTDDFIYQMESDDYQNFPDPGRRTTFSAKSVRETIYRYPNPEKPGTEFQWDIHGTLLTPTRASIENVALVMIHGGAANEFEFLYTPDGPEAFVDLTSVDPSSARVGVAQ